MNVRDERVLFTKWLRDPLRIGAVMPSGAALAHAMASALDLAAPGAVLELGGGTGAVTRALLRAGVAPRDLVIVERDEGLHGILTQRFPGCRVILGDATRAKELLAAAGIDSVKAVVSSLPLLAMSPPTQQRLLRQCFDLMGPDGLFIQFTYGPASPVPERRLARMGLRAELAERIWLNMPPATVWRFTHLRRAGTSERATRSRRARDIWRAPLRLMRRAARSARDSGFPLP